MCPHEVLTCGHTPVVTCGHMRPSMWRQPPHEKQTCVHMWICMCPHVPAACGHMQAFMWRQPPHAMCTCKLRVDTRKILMCPHVKSDLCMIFFYFFLKNYMWTHANLHVECT